MLPLFRKQALDYQRERLYGEVILIQPVSFTILTFFLVFVTCLIIIFLFMNTYTKRERVAGYIFPDQGMVPIYPSQQGILSKINVSEGKYVKKGDDLFSISIDQRMTGGKYIGFELLKALESQEDNLKSKLHIEKERLAAGISVQKKREAQLTKEISMLKKTILTQMNIIKLESGAYTRAKKMLSRGLIPEIELEQTYMTYMNQKQKLQSFQTSLDETKLSLAETKNNIITMETNSRREILSIENELAELAKQKTQVEGKRQIIVKAPIDGRIASVVVNEGQQLNPSIPLFAIIPESSRLEANLYLSTSAIGFLEIGQTINIRYNAFPYQKFGTYPGTIKEIANSVIMPGEGPSGLSFKEPVYKVVATLGSQKVQAYGRKIRLKPGMAVTADVILDERSLLEWLLEPLYSLKGTL